MRWLVPIAALGLAAAPAAAETSRPFTVSATIATGCVVVTSGGGDWGAIALGTVQGLGTQSVSAGLLSNGVTGIQIDCTPGTTIGITADQGNQPLGGTRRLVNATNAASLIPYQLFADGSATPWTTQSIPVSFPAGVTRRGLPVTATAQIAGPVRGGAYADTVRITISF